MERTVDWVMRYIEAAYPLDKSQKEVLRFGIQSAMELTINLLASILIMCKMGMVREGILFFVIFIPIRTLAGGYHADTYLRCFVFSVATLIAVLEASVFIEMPTGAALGTIIVLAAVIGKIAPIVNDQRPVSKREYRIFSRKLKVVLLLVVLLGIYCRHRRYIRALHIVVFSLVLILITLLMGKIKYKACQTSM